LRCTHLNYEHLKGERVFGGSAPACDPIRHAVNRRRASSGRRGAVRLSRYCGEPDHRQDGMPRRKRKHSARHRVHEPTASAHKVCVTTPTHEDPSSKPTSRPLVDPALLATGSLLTSEEVADALRISPRTLADWRYGRGPANGPRWLCLGDRKPLYPLSEVNRYLREQLAVADARRESMT
jgi:hypothetical protein